MESEKAAIRVVVEEINRRSEKTHAVTLRVIGWPDDIRPGVSTDVQSEVEHQIGHDFDIYIGILGIRFGTPTVRAGSGTEQEFDGALSRFQQDSTRVRLLFYFKRDTEDSFSIDIDQLQKVQEFRQNLGARGVVYRDFRDTAEFTQLVREHLDALIIDEWEGDKWVERAPAPPVNETDASSPPIVQGAKTSERTGDPDDERHQDDELGVLEYMEAAHDASEAIAVVMNTISKETERVGDEIRARSSESNQVMAELEKQKVIGSTKAHQQFLAQARATIDRAAGNLDDYATAMKPNVEQFKVQNRSLFDNMKRAFHAGVELGPRDTAEDQAALARLILVVRESREHIMAFQTSISRVPALTGRFRRSRRRAAAILGELVAEMSFSIEQAHELLDEMGP